MNDFLKNKNSKPLVYKQGSYTVRQFPESFIQLMMEIEKNHPALWFIVKNRTSPEHILEETATYCQCVVAGAYRFSELCDRLLTELRSKGAIVIVPGNSPELPS